VAKDRGRLITIEGLDGAGKTTLATGLLAAARTRGIDAELLREPGGVQTAERIRDLVIDPSLTVSPRTEALLYAAARAQLVEEALQPLLARGVTILLDRFVDSSLAYQGGGRELGVEAVRAINTFATAGLRPDLTLLLAVAPGTGRERTGNRGTASDRLEQEPEPFFARIAETYAALASAEPERFRVLDGSQPAEQVLRAARAAVFPLFGLRDGGD
jgi:dTMP kinase